MKRKAEAMRKRCAPCCSSWFSSHGCYLGGHCRSRGELRQHIMHASTSTASVGAVDRPSVLPTPCSSVSDRNPHAFSIPSSLASFVRACARRSLQTTNLETCQRKMLARLFALLLAVAPAASCECGADYPRCVPSGPDSGWCEGDPAVEQWCTTPLVCNQCGGRSGASCTSSYPSSSPPPPSPPPPSPPPPVPVPPPPSPPPHPRRPAAPGFMAQIIPRVFHYRLPAMGAGARVIRETTHLNCPATSVARGRDLSLAGHQRHHLHLARTRSSFAEMTM